MPERLQMLYWLKPGLVHRRPKWPHCSIATRPPLRLSAYRQGGRQPRLQLRRRPHPPPSSDGTVAGLTAIERLCSGMRCWWCRWIKLLRIAQTPSIGHRLSCLCLLPRSIPLSGDGSIGRVVIRDTGSPASKAASCIVTNDGGSDSFFDGLVVDYTAFIQAIFKLN